MKHILASLLVILVSLPIVANDGREVINKSGKTFLDNSFFDPGHKNRPKKDVLNKDRSPIEIYLGATPSFSVKLNNYGSTNGWLTETFYFMTSIDFNDTDLHAKIGFNLNGKSKYNQNKALLFPKLGLFNLWRYQAFRQSIEIGYKTQFLDPEETTQEKLISTNYGGLTIGYSVIVDGNGIFDKAMWYLFDHRTARRIRLKADFGFFFNFDKFNQAHLGFLSGANNSNGTDFNENVPDDSGTDDFDASNYNPNFGQPLEMPTYPVLSPFVNLSLGIALW